LLHIFIDADACPVKQEVYRVAKRYNLDVTLVTNSWMRVPPKPWIALEVVTGEFDAADDWIVEHLRPHDIVVTADILLASRCLKEGARVLGTTGKPFTDDNIVGAVATRNLLSGLRDAGEITGGPPPFEKRDRSRFLQQLDIVIQSIRRLHPKETQDERVQRVVQEHVDIVPYDSQWPELFGQEKAHLLSCLPRNVIGRIEHFGSTAVPGLAAKPIIDMLVEVTTLHKTKRQVVPILESQGYEYFWRPTWGDDTPPFYAWFIKRDSEGNRTHHIHMVEPEFEHWDRLLFRDYLVEHPEVAQEYEALKRELMKNHHADRVAYTKAKTAFIVAVTEKAKGYYQK
jgi:uncharacterized protein YaiI (UPF0178 family)/GrpB-like predicted nucleotidyltransferase (UPF0157 family)